MANSDKNIVITPNTGSSTDDPKIVFTGANSTAANPITLRAYPINGGTLSFEGSAGQLFSITNDLGVINATLFAVNDVSGMPSIEVLATGDVKLAQYAGNVGIGAAPSAKLWVHSGTNINMGMRTGQSDLTAAELGAWNDAGSATIPMEFLASKFNFTGGSVGIGTTSPSYKLQVTTGGIDGYINPNTVLGALVMGTKTAHPLVLATIDAERVRIDTSGNVGIGTASPYSKLQVSAGNSAFLPSTSAFSIQKADEGYGLFAGVNSDGRAWLQAGNRTDSTNYDIVLQSRGGNVGIGMAAPTEKLDIDGTGATFVRIHSSDNSGAAGVKFQGAGDRGSIYGDSGYNVYIEPNRQYATGNIILKAKNGDSFVGVNTASPAFHLDVAGSTRISGSIASVNHHDSLDAGLTAYFPFSEGTGTVAADRSAAGTDAALVATPTWVAGRKGYALSFNGTTQFGRVTGASTNTVVSFAAWIKTTDGSPVTNIVSGSGVFQYVSLMSNAFQVYDGAWRNGGTVTNNVWTHVAFTFDGSSKTLTLFLNGVQTYTGVGSLHTNGTLSKIGAYYDETIRFFPGAIDEIRAYNRLLSADEIRSLYDDGVTTDNPYVATGGLVGIGTTAPATPLEIKRAGSSSVGFLRLHQDSIAEMVMGVYQTNGAYFNTNADSFRFLTGLATSGGNTGTERMRITSAGNVGIGTTSPIEKLFVAGAIATNAASVGYSSAVSTAMVDFANAGMRYLSFGADASTRGAYQWYQAGANNANGLITMRMDTTGQLGIGVIPAFKLDVGGNVGLNNNNLIFPPSGGSVATDGTYGVYWHVSGSSPNSSYGIYRTSGAWTANTYQQLRLQFDTGIQLGAGSGVNAGYDKSYVEVVNGKGLMVTSGHVGLGTTAPVGYTNADRTLHIHGATLPGLKLTNDTTGQAATAGFWLEQSGLITSIWNGSAGAMRLGTSNQERFRITDTGNVGIGITSPGTKLDVLGGAVFGTSQSTRASYSNTMSLHNAGSTDTSLFLWQDGSASGHIGFKSGESTLRIVNSYSDGSLANTAAMVLDSSGKVGIGTASPTALLHVAGASLLAGGVTVANNTWHKSADGQQRHYYSANGISYFGSPYGYEWRDASDTKIASLYNNGEFVAKGYNWGSIVGVFGQPMHRTNELTDVLYRATERFTVTGGTGYAPWFDGSYDSGIGLTANATTVVNINLAGQSGIPSTGITYPQGTLYISFYYTSNNYTALSVRTKHNNGNWYSATGPTNVSTNSSFKVMAFTMPGTNYLTDIEITCTTDAVNSVNIAAVNYYCDRSTSDTELPYFSKYLSTNRYIGTLAVTGTVSATALSTSGDLSFTQAGTSHITATNALGRLGLGAGGTMNQIYIETDGKVGIGTTSPGTALHVEGAYITGKGQLYINNPTSHAYAVVNAPSGSEAGFGIGSAGTQKWFLYRPSGSNDFRIYDSAGTAGDRVTVQTVTGNVGIGTSAPGTALAFGGSGSIWVNNDSANPFGMDTVAAKLRLFTGNPSNATYQIQFGGMVSGTFTPYMSIGDGSANRGYVGIGTATPDAPLHAKGGPLMTGSWNRTATLEATFPSLVFNSASTKWAALQYDHTSSFAMRVGCTSNDVNATGATAFSISHAGVVNFPSTVTASISGNAGTATKLATARNINGVAFDGTADITVASSGGNADTVDTLHVHAGRNNEANKLVRTDANGYIQCGYINSSNGDEGNASSPSRVWGTNGSDSYMRSYQTAYLSVNYANSAGSAGSVSASAVFTAIAGNNNSDWYRTVGNTGWYNASYAVGVYSYQAGYVDAYNSANFRGPDFVSTSDARLKENVSTIPGALAKVLALRGVNFTWKSDETHKPQIGLIAQEVQEVVPEVVHADSEGTLSVSYNHLIGVLVEAIKDQQKQIDELKALVQKLVG